MATIGILILFAIPEVQNSNKEAKVTKNISNVRIYEGEINSKVIRDPDFINNSIKEGKMVEVKEEIDYTKLYDRKEEQPSSLDGLNLFLVEKEKEKQRERYIYNVEEKKVYFYEY